MTRIHNADSYRQAIVSLMHTPVRFVPGAIGEVADQHGRTRAEVEADLMALLDRQEPAGDTQGEVC